METKGKDDFEDKTKVEPKKEPPRFFPKKPQKKKQQGHNKWQRNGPPTGVIRVRTLRDNEIIGIVEQRVGANRMIVKCLDDKERNCRIPGSLRKRLWIRPGDTVIVKPWEFDGDKRGDILFKYTPAAISWLKNKGLLKEVSTDF